MIALADAIVLEVGYWQWYRMNVRRVPGVVSTKAVFLEDVSSRYRQQVIPSLIARLKPYRLALPDGYDLARRA